MSKPSTAPAPRLRSAVRATPTTPPAGPETTASRPRKASAAHQPAGRGHEVQRRAGHRVGHPAHIGLQHRRQIGVGDGRLGPRHEAGQGRDLVAQRHEGEAGRSRQLAGRGARAPD